MISANYFNRLVEMLPLEIRLVRQARSGDINAFVKLCEPHIEHVYRYVHFLMPNNRSTEGLTIQIFFKAWEQLGRYHVLETTFITWLYSLARIQVIEYFRTHKNNMDPDNAVSVAVRGGKFNQEFQAVREALTFLSPDQQHVLIMKYVVGMPDADIAHLLGERKGNIRTIQIDSLYLLSSHFARMDSKTLTTGFKRILENCLKKVTDGTATLDECLMQYPRHASQLGPLLGTALILNRGREIKPLPTFKAYTHDALTQYLRLRTRRSQVILTPAIRRTAMAFAMLIAALLVTGTAQAQAANPGDSLYGWKRTSEQVWEALAPHSTTMDIFLAERRLDEWIAVGDDPLLGVNARIEYEAALSRVESSTDAESLAAIASALQVQQAKLAQAGMTSSELDEYLEQVSEMDTQPVVEDVAQDLPEEIIPTATTIMPVAVVESTEECPPNCGKNNKGNHGMSSAVNHSNGRANGNGQGNNGQGNNGQGNNGQGNHGQGNNGQNNPGANHGGGNDKDKDKDGDNGGGGNNGSGGGKP